jgi:hypothetical protein
MKLDIVENIHGIEVLAYVERFRDGDNNIIPYVAVNGGVIDSNGTVKLSDGSEVPVAPVIGLIMSPNFVATLRTPIRPISFRTGVFLHKDLFLDFVKDGGKPDRTFLFTLTDEGMSIEDESKTQGALFLDKQSLVALGVITSEAQWNFRKKIQDWFALDYRVPTGVKPTKFFMQDISKIPVGGNLSNGQAWDMTI